jgi:hypothetical protein
LPSLRRKFRTLGGVDVNISETAKDTDVREVRVANSEGHEWDDRGTLRPGAAAKVNHSEKSEAPEVVGKSKGEKESFGTISECAPLTLHTGQLSLRIGISALDCDGGGATKCSEG